MDQSCAYSKISFLLVTFITALSDVKQKRGRAARYPSHRLFTFDTQTVKHMVNNQHCQSGASPAVIFLLALSFLVDTESYRQRRYMLECENK